MPRWEDIVMIDRPIDEVWAFMTDLFNTPRMGGYSPLGWRQTSPGPPGVGSTLQGRNVILGFETRLNHLITEWDPPHAFADTMEARPFRSLVQRVTAESTGPVPNWSSRPNSSFARRSSRFGHSSNHSPGASGSPDCGR